MCDVSVSSRPPLESRVEPLRRPRPPKRVAIDLAGSGTSSGCTDRNYASTWLAIIHLSRPFRADYGNETGRPSLRPTIHLVSHIPAVHRPHPHPFSCSLIEQYFSIQPNSELRQIFLLAREISLENVTYGPGGGKLKCNSTSCNLIYFLERWQSWVACVTRVCSCSVATLQVPEPSSWDPAFVAHEIFIRLNLWAGISHFFRQNWLDCGRQIQNISPK